MVYLGLTIGFVCGYLFRGLFYKFKDDFEKFLKKEKQEEISDELFISYMKSFRSFNVEVLKDITKTEFLKSKEFSIKEDNSLYHINDSYFMSENFIYLYRSAYCLTNKNELSNNKFIKDIFNLKEIEITNEQLALMDIDETLKKMYFKDYSCFPYSFLANYYFEEKIFVIPTLSLLEREVKEKRKESILEIKDLIQTFLNDIDDIEIDILTGELIENINIILSKISKDEMDDSTYNLFLTLLNNIKASYTLLWDNFKNKKNIEDVIDEIELNLNVLNEVLGE